MRVHPGYVNYDRWLVHQHASLRTGINNTVSRISWRNSQEIGENPEEVASSVKNRDKIEMKKAIGVNFARQMQRFIGGIIRPIYFPPSVPFLTRDHTDTAILCTDHFTRTFANSSILEEK